MKHQIILIFALVLFSACGSEKSNSKNEAQSKVASTRSSTASQDLTIITQENTSGVSEEENRLTITFNRELSDSDINDIKRDKDKYFETKGIKIKEVESYDNSSVILVLDTALQPGKSYSLKIKDIKGLKSSKTIKFSTSKDETKPKFESSDPSNNATGVLKTINPKITFSKDIDISKATIELKEGKNWDKISAAPKIDNKKSIIITPANPLKEKETYHIVIEGVTDLAGNEADKKEIEFTTKDETPPKIINTSLLDDNRTLAGKKLKISFDKDVNLDESKIKVGEDQYSTGTIATLYDFNISSINNSKQDYLLETNETLQGGTKFKIQFEEGAIKNTDGVFAIKKEFELEYMSILYITANGTNSNGGGSWDEPKGYANMDSTSSNEVVFIQKGSYKPSGMKAIGVQGSNVKFYGGFEGDETFIDERDPDAKTILDGGGSKQLVTISNMNNITMDGFTIQNGSSANGGGMQISDAKGIMLKNIEFKNNKATNAGGGAIYLDSASEVEIENVSFIENNASDAAGAGGAIRVGDKDSKIEITNATFKGNLAEGSGGAIKTIGKLTARNASFIENKAEENGGAIHAGYNNPLPEIKLINTTFVGNEAMKEGGGVYIGTSGPSTLTIKNSIFLDNKKNSANGSDIEAVNLQVLTITAKSLISRQMFSGTGPTFSSENPINDDPSLTTSVQNKTVNGVEHFFYGLNTGSPAINKGSNDDNNATTDQIGNPRKNGIIDIGAVEIQ